jgi:hypothetical protein
MMRTDDSITAKPDNRKIRDGPGPFRKSVAALGGLAAAAENGHNYDSCGRGRKMAALNETPPDPRGWR